MLPVLIFLQIKPVCSVVGGGRGTFICSICNHHRKCLASRNPGFACFQLEQLCLVLSLEGPLLAGPRGPLLPESDLHRTNLEVPVGGGPPAIFQG